MCSFDRMGVFSGTLKGSGEALDPTAVSTDAWQVATVPGRRK